MKQKKILLKTDPAIFDANWRGDMVCNYRKDDRDVQLGDILILLETKHTGKQMAEENFPLEYTGRRIHARVTHVLRAPFYDLPEGQCVISFGNGFARVTQSSGCVYCDLDCCTPERHIGAKQC